MKRVFIATVLSVCASVTIHAETPNRDLTGFQCFKLDEKALHITPDDAFAGRGLPRVFAEPSSSSKEIGSTGGIEYVAWPLKKQNGFMQILRVNGQLGWVIENAFIPLRKADGTIGGCTLQREPNGLILHKLDPGVAVRF